MKQTFLHKGNNNGRLILIFAGWGSDMSLYKQIEMPGWDVMLCWDYNDFHCDETTIAQYHTIYLYAWSLGVFVAEHALKNISPTLAVAVNGTLNPVSDDEGIPQAIYHGTMNALSEQSFRKFQMRMFENSAQYRQYADKLPINPIIEDLRHQLNLIAKTSPTEGNIKWDYRFAGRNDRIFPLENQIRAWQGGNKTIETDSPHFIDLDTIIKSTIMSAEQVGFRFNRSRATYNDNAIAQNIIIDHLAKQIKADDKKKGRKLLEIGCGTGLFTNAYSKLLQVDHATLVDICEVPELMIADSMSYIQADAEQWLEQLNDDEKFDFILSSSTIQWFGNLDRFFFNAKKHLANEGVICVSTFAPGNLAELDKFRLSPIRYLSVEEINTILSKYFSDFYVNEDVIELTFDSAFDAMKHLRLTGVTASGQKNSASELKKFINGFSKNKEGKYLLTYRPIYIYVKH